MLGEGTCWMSRKMGVANQQTGKSVFVFVFLIVLPQSEASSTTISPLSKLIYDIDPHSIIIYQVQFMKR